MIMRVIAPILEVFTDCVWKPFINNLPFDNSPVLQVIVAVIIMLAVSWLWWKSLGWLYSGENIAPVAQPVRKPVAIAGAILGVLALLQLFRYETIFMVANIGYATGGVMLLVWGVGKTCTLPCSPIRKMLVFVSFLGFVLQAFILGLLVATASAIIIAFAFALYLALDAASASSKRSSNDEVSIPSEPERKELEDGTIIEKGWGSWFDVNDSSKRYKEDWGGAFSRTN